MNECGGETHSAASFIEKPPVFADSLSSVSSGLSFSCAAAGLAEELTSTWSVRNSVPLCL